MCGIYFRITNGSFTLEMIKTQSNVLKHRGPDNFKTVQSPPFHFAFHRLAIMDPGLMAMQPFEIDGMICMVNGEIYNVDYLCHRYNLKRQTACDSEVVPLLYRKMCQYQRSTDIIAFLQALDGMFAFVLVDKNNGSVLIARDHMGIIPLYWSTEPDLCVASEMKALPSSAKIFPPRSFVYQTKKNPSRRVQTWYDPHWSVRRYNSLNHTAYYQEIRRVFSAAIQSHIQCDVPFGCLLSGGLDSSLVAAMTATLLPGHLPLHTFTIGLEDCEDFEYAEEVSKYIGSKHHAFVYTLEEGLAAIPEVIRHIETFDVTTVRSSTPQYLLAKEIQKMGFKMVLSGEGADEAWGGYAYFHYAPSVQAFQQEIQTKLNELHLYDCLRTNKSMAAFSIECRVPFLDRSFLKVALTLPTKMKMPTFYQFQNKPIEKGILRSAFPSLLPKRVLWREKAQFSDSVGKTWIKGIKEHCSSMGMTEKEWYQSLFESYGYNPQTVPQNDSSIACSTGEGAKWVKGGVSDPSGRISKDL